MSITAERKSALGDGVGVDAIVIVAILDYGREIN